MKLDRLADIQSARDTAGRLYEEFLREPSMSAGLYELPAGGMDPQRPHAEDELYYVISGAATFEYRDERHEVGAGDTIFVEAHAPHRFVDIREDLAVLVVFAPAETG